MGKRKQPAKCRCNGRCDECRQKIEMKAFEERQKIIKNCKGEHLLENVRALYEHDKKKYARAYSNKTAVIAEVVDGPWSLTCDKCGEKFDYYAVRWEGSSEDFSWGRGVTIIASTEMDDCVDVVEYEKRKAEVVKERLRASKRQLVAQLRLDSKL
ncbi:hypothetical protein niasHS_004915 [Heterodera schachtii]|uniref:Uncharacterized protein n=1 Tax=Heterodera schachtii TaxID=97005 RepID=A0ABD2K058_HETSC